MTSARKFAAGSWVETSAFGRAIVVSTSDTGILVRLPEFGGLEVEISTEEIVASQSPMNEHSAPYDANPTLRHTAPLDGDVEARRSIEALRFGLVPERRLEALTLGFASLKSWVLGRLPHNRGGIPQASAITGPFGTGKSHTMAVVRHIARQQRYVTARVEVDGQTISLSQPAKLLHQLWQSTDAGEGRTSTPLLDLYLKAIASGRLAPSIAPRGIDRIKNNYGVIATLKRSGCVDRFSADIESLLSSSDEITTPQLHRKIKMEANVNLGIWKPRPMIGTSVDDRPYDFVEVLAGHAVVAKLAGYRGLVITIDEFEVEEAFLGRSYARVEDLINVLTRYLRKELDYEPAPLSVFFATVGSSSHIGDGLIDRIVTLDPESTHELEPWPASQRQELARRLCDVYAAAYGFDLPFDSAIASRVESQLHQSDIDDSGMIRAFIKRYMAALDGTYGPPHA